MAPFIIMSLPRSRSTWLAHYLSYGGKRCGHDLAIECPTFGAFIGSFGGADGVVGSCETGASMAWRLLAARMPGLRLIVVRRPVEMVFASLLRLGIQVDVSDLEAREAQLELISAQPETRTIDFADLASPLICQALFEYCLGVDWDFAWWERLAGVNIQIDMAHHLALLERNAGQIARLKAEVLAEQSRLGAMPCLH